MEGQDLKAMLHQQGLKKDFNEAISNFNELENKIKVRNDNHRSIEL